MYARSGWNGACGLFFSLFSLLTRDRSEEASGGSFRRSSRRPIGKRCIKPDRSSLVALKKKLDLFLLTLLAPRPSLFPVCRPGPEPRGLPGDGLLLRQGPQAKPLARSLEPQARREWNLGVRLLVPARREASRHRRPPLRPLRRRLPPPREQAGRGGAALFVAAADAGASAAAAAAAEDLLLRAPSSPSSATSAPGDDGDGN